jgi:predicted acyltransferase
VRTVGHRIESLDVFRGLAVAAMIVVNNPGNWGAVYPPLEHAAWNGWTFADSVFPSFVFIVGVTLPLAFARRLERMNRCAVLRAIVTRGAVLVALGLILNCADGFPPLARVRFTGVLQRIALAYLIAAPIVLHTTPRSWLVAVVALLALHTGLIWMPFAGQPAGTMTPAHNLAGQVDARILGSHMFRPTSDPEGLLGTLSTAATMLLGAVAGGWFAASSDDRQRLAGLAGAGLLMVAAGLVWSLWLPLNKSLWTGSYATLSAGMAALVFAVCYYVVDSRERRLWARPFVWLGVNPLAVYFLSELTRHLLDFAWIESGSQPIAPKDALFWRYLVRLTGGAAGAGASLVFALAFTGLWIGVAGVLYRRGIRIRV